jgi:hypothetical protein
MASPTVRSGIRVLLGAIRDGWLIAGITLALLILVMGAYELVSDLRNPPPERPDLSPLHPYAHEAWWPAFQGAEGLYGRKNLWDPYRGWRSAAYRAPGITVDSAGVRLTVPPARDSAAAVRLVMLGGSEVWGYAARDSFTIPSLVAQRLRGDGFDNVEVTNLAVPAYNATQEATTLLVELAHGRHPDVVVVMDGFNDLVTAYQYGGPGHVISEQSIQSKLDLGSRGFWEELFGLGRHWALVRRLVGNEEGGPLHRTEVACQPVAEYYGRLVRSMEALGREYGFDIVFFQQPSDVTSQKRPSEWERTFESPPRRVEWFKRCAVAIDSTMGVRRGRTYLPLYSLFSRDTGTVFTDWSSHTTERANGVIADSMVEVLAPLLRSRAARGIAPLTARP